MDEELNRVYPERTSSRVEIRLQSGERLARQVDIPRGDPRDPLTAQDIAEKVRLFAGERDQKKTGRIIEMILNLESLMNIRELAALI